MPSRLLAAALLLPMACGISRAAQDEGQAAYQAGHFDAARAIWRARAEAGDADAAFGLGLLYDLGQGVNQDGGAAYEWYLRAAAAGDPQAELNVAVMNDSGRGTVRNQAAAATWYGRAAAHGLGRAEYDLAQLYEAGEGVPRNLDAAFAWYQAASAVLPAATARAAQLRARIGNDAAGNAALAPPLPSGSAGTMAMGRAAELVWSAPRQPSPVRYYVVVMSLDAAPPAPVFSGFTDRTAMMVPAVSGLRAYAWRVCAVSLETPHYAASSWEVVGR